MADDDMRERLAKAAEKPKDCITSHTLLGCLRDAYRMSRQTWANFEKCYKPGPFNLAMSYVNL